ncbi:hypothetical protein GCM10027569_86950 [Flindersiella endophytica]
MLVAGEALSVLNDAIPPPPPLRYPEEGVTADDGLPSALEALAQAGATAAQDVPTDRAFKRDERATRGVNRHRLLTE